MKSEEKTVLAMGLAAIALDIIMNNGKYTMMVLEKIIAKQEKEKIYLTEKDLADCSFGC